MPKTIFNTTEKSNFILNMKDETVDKLSLIVLSAVCILITISQIPAEFGYGMTDVPFLAVGISGVLSVVTGIILLLRKRCTKKNLAGVIIIAFLFVWSLVSYYTAYNMNTALWGQDGRYDGIIAMIVYIFLFLTASMISQKKIERFFDIIVAVGFFQCLWAVYQTSPVGTSYYKNLEVIAVKDVQLTSGLTGSPIFFAMLMSVLTVISMMGSLFSDNSKRRSLYTIATAFFTFGAFQTHTLSGIIGIVLIYLVFIGVMIIKRKEIKDKAYINAIIAYIAFAVILVVELVAGYRFYDGGIVWQDSFYRLGVTGYYSFTASDFDVNNLKELYSYLWNEAVSAIKQFPLTGTGVDCFSYTQYKTTNILQYEFNSIDRPYNDYLFLCATRGIPYLIGYIALLIYSLICSIKNSKKYDKWYFKALPFAIIVFMIVSIFNNSAVSVMPFIWIILGLSVNKKITDK